MCGIVGGVAQRDVAPILLEGLKRLEYRGYDSAGMAAINGTGCIARHRKVGKVAELEKAMQAEPLPGGIGIAHTFQRFSFFGRCQPLIVICLLRSSVNSASGASRVIVEPAPMVASSATVTGATSAVLEPIKTLLPMMVLCLLAPS